MAVMQKKPNSPESDLPPSVQEFGARLSKLFPDLKPDEVSKFKIVYEELVRFSKTLNLVSPLTLKTADATHFGDCIFAWRLIEKVVVPGKPIFDFGSGNGFPGLAFAILSPKNKFCLVERDGRKAEYLKAVASRAGLSNVEVLIKNVEDLEANSVANGVSRGFAPLHKTLIVTRKAFQKGGKLFNLKGDGWATELGSVPSQIFSHWNPSLLGQYKVPSTVSEMAVVLTDKIAD